MYSPVELSTDPDRDRDPRRAEAPLAIDCSGRIRTTPYTARTNPITIETKFMPIPPFFSVLDKVAFTSLGLIVALAIITKLKIAIATITIPQIIKIIPSTV